MTAAGAAAVFDRAALLPSSPSSSTASWSGRVGFLNASPGDAVRSIFLNRAAPGDGGAVITVSVCRSDRFSSLRCASTPVAAIAAAAAALRSSIVGGCGGPSPTATEAAQASLSAATTPLFSGAPLRWPGFVEFDDVNGVLLTFCAASGAYAVHDLARYEERRERSERREREREREETEGGVFSLHASLFSTRPLPPFSLISSFLSFPFFPPKKLRAPVHHPRGWGPRSPHRPGRAAAGHGGRQSGGAGRTHAPAAHPLPPALHR